ncbi:hypothetical protein BDQ17DRAFT_1239048 [Cyathus striatus]|nr:hypothetical protein BDQ17DRAFT_1239048 [Cyathus striatus]
MATRSDTNIIPFPTVSGTNHSELSATSIPPSRATALDVCYSVYGETPSTEDVVDQFYEANAGIYENPFLTATSRSVIGDIHRLSRRFSSVDVPRPLAVLCTLFRIRPPNVWFLGHRSEDPLFQALRVWTDIGDVCESESFDGNRRAVTEHTLNILLLPGIHRDSDISQHSYPPSDSLVNISGSQQYRHRFTSPSLPIPGTSFSIPSPLHFRLQIITRLTFNEQGRVTHHRDIWDVKDVMGLVPGVSLAQWVGTRLAATGMSYIARFLPNDSYSEESTSHTPANVDNDNWDYGMKV